MRPAVAELLLKPKRFLPLTMANIVDPYGNAWTPGQPFCIYPARANLRTNNNFATNATGWTGLLSATVGRVTTHFAPGSIASGEITTPGVATGEGVEAAGISVTASNPYTDGIQVLAPVGATIRMQLAERLVADLVDITTTNTDFVGTGVWQSIAVSKTLGATSVIEHIRFLTVTSIQAITFWVSQSMLQTGLINAPFTASSIGAGRLQAPSSVLNATQGAVVTRVTSPWASANIPNTAPTLFSWRVATADTVPPTDEIRMAYFAGVIDSVKSTGSSPDLKTSTVSWSAGSSNTFAQEWNATIQGISFNGSAWDTGNSAKIPVLTAAPTFDLLSYGNTRSAANFYIADSGLNYAAFYDNLSRPLSTGDLAQINAWGNNAPADLNAWPGNPSGLIHPLLGNVMQVRP